MLVNSFPANVERTIAGAKTKREKDWRRKQEGSQLRTFLKNITIMNWCSACHSGTSLDNESVGLSRGEGGENGVLGEEERRDFKLLE
jgi:hypothetical protein